MADEEIENDDEGNDEVDADSVSTEEESSSSEESSDGNDGIEDDKNLSDHIDQLTTDMVVDIAGKAGAIVDADTASELKTTVMNRLRYVLMVALQFSHHENAPGLGYRDFEKAEEAVLDTSGTRKMFSPVKESEKTIDLLKSVSHEKFNDIPVENFNPRFKVHCPNYFRYVQADDEDGCEDCIVNNAGFEDADQFFISEEELKCLSSSDEVEFDDSDERLEELSPPDKSSEEEEPSKIENEMTSNESSPENGNEHLEEVKWEYVSEECDLTKLQFNSDECEMEVEPVVQEYNSPERIDDLHDPQDNNIENAVINESKFINVSEEGYTIVDENQDNFTEQLIETEEDLNDSSSSTNRYLVHEYVDDEGNSYLVTQDSTIANSEGFISDAILTEQKPECDFENEQRVFEYTEEGMHAENEEEYIATVPVEEPIVSGQEEIISDQDQEEMICETTIKATIVPTQSVIDEDITVSETTYIPKPCTIDAVEEVELESSDEEVELLNTEDEIEFSDSQNEEDEIELEVENSEDELSDCDGVNLECLEEEVTFQNPEDPDIIKWTECDQEVELKLVDQEQLLNDNGIQSEIPTGSYEEDEEIEFEISDEEIEIRDSSDDESDSSKSSISEVDSENGDEQNSSTGEGSPNLSELFSSENPDGFVEYVAVDVMFINENDAIDTAQQSFEYQEYLDNEVVFEDFNIKIPQTAINEPDLEIEVYNSENLTYNDTDILNNDQDKLTAAEDENDEDAYKWQNDDQNEQEKRQKLPSLEDQWQPNIVESYEYEDDVVESEDDDDDTNMDDCGSGTVCITEIPELDIEYNYSASGFHCGSTTDDLIEYPDTEIDLVDSEGEAEVSDSDTEILLQDEIESTESESDASTSTDSEYSVSDSSETEESESDEVQNDLTLQNSPESNGDSEYHNHEYAQVHDFVIFENSTETTEYRIDYETLQLDVTNCPGSPKRFSVGTQYPENVWNRKGSLLNDSEIFKKPYGVPKKPANSRKTEDSKKSEDLEKAEDPEKIDDPEKPEDPDKVLDSKAAENPEIVDGKVEDSENTENLEKGSVLINDENSKKVEDSEEAEGSIATEDSKIAEDSKMPEGFIKVEDSKIEEDSMKVQDSIIPEDFIKSEDSKIPEDIIKSEDTKIPEDFIKSEDSKMPENFIKVEDSKTSSGVKEMYVAEAKVDLLINSCLQEADADELYVVEFEDIEHMTECNDNEAIEVPAVCLVIDEHNNCVAIDGPPEDEPCEASSISADVSVNKVEFVVSETTEEMTPSPNDGILDENVNSDSPESSESAESLDIDTTDERFENSNLQGVLLVESYDNSVLHKYESDDKVEEDMEIVPVKVEVADASTIECDNGNDFCDNGDNFGQDVSYEVANVDANVSEVISDNNEDIQETMEQSDLVADMVDNALFELFPHMNDTEQEEYDASNIIEEEENEILENVTNNDDNLEDLSETENDSIDFTPDEVVLNRYSDDIDLQLIRITSDCLDDTSNSSNEAEEDVQEEPIMKSCSDMDFGITNMSHHYPILPIEWKDYMKMFVSCFFRNTDIHTNDVDICEFKVILQDMRIHGALPVLDIILDFFLDYIRKRNELLESGKTLTKEMKICLSLISATIKTVLDCPLDCSQMHLKMISSVLVELLTLPTPCKHQQGIIQSFLKVILKHDELLEWTKAFITETLQRTVQILLWNLPDDTKCILGGAIELANGLETIGIHIAGEHSWETQILVLSKRYHLMKSYPWVFTDGLSENDTYIEHSIFIFLKNFCYQYSHLPKLYTFRLRNFVNEMYGERMTMYLNAEVLNPLNDGKVVKEKARSNTNSTCNVCFKTDKSKSIGKLFSKRSRTGNERKYKSGNAMSLSAML